MNKATSEQVKDSVLLSLLYALETFQGACNCGKCDPCTNGQKYLRKAIKLRRRELRAAEQVRRVVNHLNQTFTDGWSKVDKADLLDNQERLGGAVMKIVDIWNRA